MEATPRPEDRRSSVRTRSREAILTAAAELMEQRRRTDFSVDDLARTADISRRTIFNHFTSLDDVVTTVAGRMLTTVVDDMRAQAMNPAREKSTILDDLAATASGDNLVPTIAYLIEVFDGDDDRAEVRGAVLMRDSLTLFTQRMSAAIAHRHPDTDPLTVNLLVAAFSGGLIGIVEPWAETGGATDTPDSRRAWDRYITRLTDVLREPAP
ncbi:TetR/AcrR family transcriptional regulator [Salininema proteolyticum]|uniref:TetR/AcrR family transcriptional regulator n=1 Tax=Salininema proteolyticum TaxID=1607685 RepID=A0ABV8U484_9ACTN